MKKDWAIINIARTVDCSWHFFADLIWLIYQFFIWKDKGRISARFLVDLLMLLLRIEKGLLSLIFFRCFAAILQSYCSLIVKYHVLGNIGILAHWNFNIMFSSSLLYLIRFDYICNIRIQLDVIILLSCFLIISLLFKLQIFGCTNVRTWKFLIWLNIFQK